MCRCTQEVAPHFASVFIGICKVVWTKIFYALVWCIAFAFTTSSISFIAYVIISYKWFDAETSEARKQQREECICLHLSMLVPVQMWVLVQRSRIILAFLLSKLHLGNVQKQLLSFWVRIHQHCLCGKKSVWVCWLQWVLIQTPQSSTHLEHVPDVCTLKHNFRKSLTWKKFSF